MAFGGSAKNARRQPMLTSAEITALRQSASDDLRLPDPGAVCARACARACLGKVAIRSFGARGT